MFIESGEELIGQIDCSRCNGHRAGTDLCIGAYFLCDSKRVLQQTAQLLPQSCGTLSVSKCIFELAQYLRFPEDHRIQTTGDAEDVSDCRVIVEREQRVAEGRLKIAIIKQPVAHVIAPAIVRYYIEFRAVAGR